MAKRFDIRDRFWLFGGSNPLTPYTIGGVKPALIMDAKAGVYAIDGLISPRSAVIPISRASAATNASGTGELATAAANELRLDYDPAALTPRGVLIESALTPVTNVASLSTQTVVVSSATAYVLHFTGTGTVVLSGAASATIVGTGTGEANRVSLAFTSASTSLTLTVTGTVSFAQLEAGSTPTSFVPQGNVTRAKDVSSIALSAFGFDTTQGTILVEWETDKNGIANVFSIDNGSSTNRILIYSSGVTADFTYAKVFSSGATVATMTSGQAVAGVAQRHAFAWAANDFAVSNNGGAPATDTLGAVPTGLTTLRFGNNPLGTSELSGRLSMLIYYPARLSNADLQTWSGA